MLPSGNDAAISIAERIGAMISPEPDPLTQYIFRMNKYAKSFGLEKHFSLTHTVCQQA
jgi:D-alanyl-D-alanine carboxypeptidase